MPLKRAQGPLRTGMQYVRFLPQILGKYFTIFHLQMKAAHFLKKPCVFESQTRDFFLQGMVEGSCNYFSAIKMKTYFCILIYVHIFILKLCVF